MTSHFASVLIAEDDLDLARALRRRLERLGARVHIESDAFAALRYASERRPDLAIVDVGLGAVNGLSMCEMIADSDLREGTRLIVLTGRDDPETIQRCHRACAYYVQKCPNVWDRLEPLFHELLAEQREPERAPARSLAHGELLDTIFTLLGADEGALSESPIGGVVSEASPEKSTDRPWVLCVDDDEDFTRMLKQRLEARGYLALRANGGDDGLAVARTSLPTAILLDYNMPGVQGDEVLRRLKRDPRTSGVPVIVVSGNRAPALAWRLFELGAAAYLNKPVDLDELCAELTHQLSKSRTGAYAGA